MSREMRDIFFFWKIEILLTVKYAKDSYRPKRDSHADLMNA